MPKCRSTIWRRHRPGIGPLAFERIRRGSLPALLLLLLLSDLSSAAPPLGELQSALVYRISQFVTWPEDAFEGKNAPFYICVYGDDPLNRSSILKRELQRKKLHGRSILVAALEDRDAAQSWSGKHDACHVLFVTEDADDGWSEVWPRSKEGRTLIIGENEEILETGGLIALVLRSGKIRPIGHESVLKSSAIKFDSRLMQLIRSP